MVGFGATLFPFLESALGKPQFEGGFALRKIIFLTPIEKSFTQALH
jgi:hypothetical protein